MRRLSLRPTDSAASKPLTSAANVVSKPSGSNRVIGATPDRPFDIARHTSSTVLPTAQIAPSPVITTRRRDRWSDSVMTVLNSWATSRSAAHPRPGGGDVDIGVDCRTKMLVAPDHGEADLQVTAPGFPR